MFFSIFFNFFLRYRTHTPTSSNRIEYHNQKWRELLYVTTCIFKTTSRSSQYTMFHTKINDG